jgi:hypothetical protein
LPTHDLAERPLNSSRDFQGQGLHALIDSEWHRKNRGRRVWQTV